MKDAFGTTKTISANRKFAILAVATALVLLGAAVYMVIQSRQEGISQTTVNTTNPSGGTNPIQPKELKSVDENLETTKQKLNQDLDTTDLEQDIDTLL